MADNTVPVFAAVPDGLLSFACDRCQQPCCKTGGLVIFPHERQRFVSRHPALELVAPADTGGVEIFATPQDGCWFLNDAKCDLHDSGKPAACNLFPFNLFGHLDGTLVVAPNALCPLQIQADGQGVSHDTIYAELASHGAAGAPPEALRQQPRADELRLEAIIRDGSGASLAEVSPVPLVAFANLATRAFVDGGAAGLAALDLAPLDDEIERLWQWADAMAALLSLQAVDEDSLAQVAPLIAAWTSTIRLFGLPNTALDDLPRALLLLALYASQWQGLRRERPMTPHALMQMLSSLRPTIEWLCRWDAGWRGAGLQVQDVALAAGDKPGDLLKRLPQDELNRTIILRALAAAHQQASAQGAAP